MATPPAPPDSRIRFDKTINLGHLLTFVGFLATMMLGWGAMDKRVTVLEEARITQREREIVRELAIKEKFTEVRDALNDLRRSVEKVADKVGAK